MEIIPNSFVMQKTTDEHILQKKLEGANEETKDEELMNVCKDFESIFIHMMLREMRKTVPDDGYVERSTATKIFEDMFDAEIAKQIAHDGEGDMGLAKMLYEQLKDKNVVKI